MNREETNPMQQTPSAEARTTAQVEAELFYQRHFPHDPSLRPMVKGDMQQQARALMAMLQGREGF